MDEYQHWRKVAREEFTRGQIVQTAADNLDLCSPIWNAMQDELQYRDRLDTRKIFRREMREAEEKDKLKKHSSKCLILKGEKEPKTGL